MDRTTTASRIATFQQLSVALDECFNFFTDGPDGTSLTTEQKSEYIADVLKTFEPDAAELERMALFDPHKPYTRNIMIDAAVYTVALYCWNAEAQSSVHSHPCEFCLHMLLCGSLKIEKFQCAPGSLHIASPDKPTRSISLSIASLPYAEHITWWPNAVDSDATVFALVPRRTRIGCYSVRGIRTPRLEAKLSLHGKMLQELKEKAARIPACSFTTSNAQGSLPVDRGRRASSSRRKSEVLIKKGQTTYQLGETIGRGAFGSVYQALNRGNGEFVAIKRIPLLNATGGAQTLDNIRAIESEILLLETFDHPNIIRYICSIRDGDAFYIITEMMESKSLEHIIERFGNFEEPLARRYLVQVLFGLQYLHRRGVIHRDIKAGNVLVSKSGVLKLADFGVSCTTPQETQFNMDDVESSDVVGSPYWMAPEVIEQRKPTTKSDVWSVGCLIIEMITGYPPYFALPPMKAFWRIISDPHPPLPKSSPGLIALLLLCFNKDTDGRADVDDLLGHAWIAEAPVDEGLDA